MSYDINFCMTFGAGVIVGCMLMGAIIYLVGGPSEIEDDFDENLR